MIKRTNKKIGKRTKRWQKDDKRRKRNVTEMTKRWKRDEINAKERWQRRWQRDEKKGKKTKEEGEMIKRWKYNDTKEITMRSYDKEMMKRWLKKIW